MDVSRKVLDAMPGCEEPFAADSAIISAAKQKLGGQDGVSASNGTGIKLEQGESVPDKLCANIVSFSINTYEWDPYIRENNAGGTASINISSNR